MNCDNQILLPNYIKEAFDYLKGGTNMEINWTENQCKIFDLENFKDGN